MRKKIERKQLRKKKVLEDRHRDYKRYTMKRKKEALLFKRYFFPILYLERKSVKQSPDVSRSLNVS